MPKFSLAQSFDSSIPYPVLDLSFLVDGKKKAPRRRKIVDIRDKDAVQAAKDGQRIMTSREAKMVEEKQFSSWDKFYKQHDNHFYKDRHYLHTSFPELLGAEGKNHDASHRAPLSSSVDPVCTVDEAADFLDRHHLTPGFPTILDAGCGVGNALFPILQANPLASFYAFDVSKHAVELMRRVAVTRALSMCGMELRDCKCPPGVKPCLEGEGPRARTSVLGNPTPEAGAIASKCGVASQVRVKGWVCDPTAQDLPRGTEETCDHALLIFVLSAIPPELQVAFLTRIRSALKPGGTVLFRDYAENDLAMLRFPSRVRKENPKLYVRGEGTLAYFFSEEDLNNVCKKAGLKVVKLDEVKKTHHNLADGTEWERRFWSGRFQRVD